MFHGLQDFYGFMFFTWVRRVFVLTPIAVESAVLVHFIVFIRISILHGLHDFYVLCVVGLLGPAFSLFTCTVLACLKKVFDILLSDKEFQAIRDQLGSR